ncbi:unnamed protein product [marine sediment metagenome]|uniref:Uncharacterized protein n=1 Tax=marine sediment metagenome TaxID=412755 RepID=X1PKJ6_9ZZZZ
MNYNLVQREVKALGEDLTELGIKIIEEPEGPEPTIGPPRGHPVLPVPDISAQLTCIQHRLSAVLDYIQGANQ